MNVELDQYKDFKKLAKNDSWIRAIMALKGLTPRQKIKRIEKGMTKLEKVLR